MAVYAIRAGDTDLYKIGWSKNPQSRLCQFQTASPHQLKLVAVLATDDREAEGRIHAALRSEQQVGEWFKLPDAPTIEHLDDWSHYSPPPPERPPRRPTAGFDPVGISDIAERTGAKEITVRKWPERHDETKEHPFPRSRTASGRPVWNGPEVLAWLRATNRHRYADAWERWLGAKGSVTG